VEYKSVNEYNDIPAHVVAELEALHVSDTGFFMGEDWPPDVETSVPGSSD
jgi:hypothetical protein